MKRLAAMLLAGALALAPCGAMAWTSDGHRAVGFIAEQLIEGSAAQRQVAALLLPGENLARAAIWADCLKATFCGPHTAEMDAWLAANPRHNEYHYTNVPFQLEHYREHAVGTDDDDIVQILRQCIAVLRNQGSEAANPHHFTPRIALLLLVHLVGDIHQPLHVAGTYVNRDGAFMLPQTRSQIDGRGIFDARGGSSLLLDPSMVESPTGSRSFHAYWDHTVPDYAMRRSGARSPQQFAQIVIAAGPAVPVDAGDAAGWPLLWSDDTLAVSHLAMAGVTAGALAQDGTHRAWPLSLPADYPVTSSALARTQLIKGGYRLAAVLKAIWP
jgi:hypothetical protein